MSEENLPTSEEGLEPEDQYEDLSKGDAMAGVFTAPGDTYEAIANSPKKNYWIIPVLISVVIGLIATFLFMQDAELAGKTMEKQREKMQEQFDKSIKEGKMTQEQADKTLETINPQSTFFRILGFGGALVGPFIILFILSLVYFVILKIMKADIDYFSILNVVGLAMLITAIGSLLSMVISIVKGEMSSVGLALLLSESTAGEKVHALLTKLDAFSIWFYVVVAIGLSKVARIEMIKSASIVFVIFLLYAVITSIVF